MLVLHCFRFFDLLTEETSKRNENKTNNNQLHYNETNSTDSKTIKNSAKDSLLTHIQTNIIKTLTTSF